MPGVPRDGEWERGLIDVTAAGPQLAWAVGYTGWEDSVETSMRAWDGSRWRAIPVENAPGRGSIDSDGPRNAWMLDGAVARHWDGQTWRRYRLGGQGGDVAVDGRRVAVISDNAVLTWNGAAFATEKRLGGEETRLIAVDTRAGHTWVAGRQGAERAVIWHGHDGRYEKTTLGEGFLNAILQVGPDDVWAVGGTDERPLALHWNGRSWQRPAIPSWKGDLNSVTAFGPDDVWFAGEAHDKPGGISVLHWDGRSWTAEVPPPSGDGDYALIERIPGTSQLWLMVNVARGDSESIVTFRRE